MLLLVVLPLPLPDPLEDAVAPLFLELVFPFPFPFPDKSYVESRESLFTGIPDFEGDFAGRGPVGRFETTSGVTNVSQST